MTRTKYWLSILAISVVLIAGPLAVNPIAIADDDDDDDDDDVRMEWLACRPTTGGQPGDPICDLQSGAGLNDLVDEEPEGTLVDIEPNTSVHQSIWESAPLEDPLTLLPGSVTLDLVMMNHAENTGPPAPLGVGDQDICWSKHAVLPDLSEIVIVAPHCFENPLPETPGVCSFGATPPSAACIALADLVSETVPSLIAAPTVLPAGTVIELSVFCPGSSFIGVFFNNGIDVDGDGILEFSKVSESVEIDVVVGELLSLNTGALLLGGLATSAFWIVPIGAAVAGTGIYIAKTRLAKDEN